jgi:hypothetical protein
MPASTDTSRPSASDGLPQATRRSSPGLEYRRFRIEDLAGVLRLWEEAGWGPLTPQQWREWYVDTPDGESIIIVAVDGDGEIAGQGVLTPTRVALGGEDVPSLRLSAPILRSDLRTGRLKRSDHPAVGMLAVGTALAESLGYRLIYAMPDRAWLPFFRWLPRFDHARFGCVAVRPGASGISATGHYEARAVTSYGREFEQLWEAARGGMPVEIGVVRSPDRLAYKNGGHLAVEVRDNRCGSLLGYAAVKKANGLLVDLLARSREDLTHVLRAIVGWLAEAPAGSWGEDGLLKAMVTPQLATALASLEFQAIDYEFLFVCHALDGSLSREAVDPTRWYLTPGD